MNRRGEQNARSKTEDGKHWETDGKHGKQKCVLSIKKRKAKIRMKLQRMSQRREDTS